MVSVVHFTDVCVKSGKERCISSFRVKTDVKAVLKTLRGIMNRNGIASLQQGALGEAAVLKELIKQGYTVFTQFSGHSPFDIVAYKDNILFRVSVKSTIVDEGRKSWRVNLVQKLGNGERKNFDKTSADILAVYIVLEDRIVLFDTNTITNVRSINIPKEKK